MAKVIHRLSRETIDRIAAGFLITETVYPFNTLGLNPQWGPAKTRERCERASWELGWCRLHLHFNYCEGLSFTFHARWFVQDGGLKFLQIKDNGTGIRVRHVDVFVALVTFPERGSGNSLWEVHHLQVDLLWRSGSYFYFWFSWGGTCQYFSEFIFSLFVKPRYNSRCSSFDHDNDGGCQMCMEGPL